MKKLTILIYLIIYSYQVLAQTAPSFISDIGYIDLEETIPLDSTLISLNSERENYGLTPISLNWKQLKWEVSYYQNSFVTGLKNEKNELGKIIAKQVDENGKITAYSEYDIQNNQLNGNAFNFIDNKINKTEKYQHNQLEGEMIFFDTLGQPLYRAEFKKNLPWNGTTAYYRIGRKTGKRFPGTEDHYQDGLKTKSVSYHFEIDSIVVQRITFYKNEKIHLVESYHQNGQLSHITPYGSFQLASGEAKGWDDEGNLSLKHNNLFGKTHGKSFNTYYDENTTWYWYGKKLKNEAAFKTKEASYANPHFFQDSIYNVLALKASIEEKWQENIDQEKNLLQVLEESFFSKHKNLIYFRKVCEKIGKTQQVKLLPSLREIYKKIAEQCLIEYDSKVHPVFNDKIGHTIRGLRKTILQLEIAEQNFNTEKEEIDFLIKNATNKIIGEIDFVDAEFQLLHECGMPVLVQEAVKLVDQSDHLLVKLFGINLLQKLEADSLRPILLERIDSFKDKSPVYLWMLQMMASIGEETDIDFLVNVIIQNEDEFITHEVSRVLWNKKQKNQWIKKWILKSPVIREQVGGRSFGSRSFNTYISPTVTDLNYFAYHGRSQKIALVSGTYFGDFSTIQLIEILETSNDHLELIKASNTLGEKHMAGQLQLTPKEQNRIDKIVSNYIENSRKQYGHFCSSELQIERLWFLAEPMLWKYLNDENFRNTAFVARQLAKMKTSEQIQTALELAKDCKSKSECRNIFTYFDILQYPQKNDSPRRNPMSDVEFQKLNNELILPLVDNLNY